MMKQNWSRIHTQKVASKKKQKRDRWDSNLDLSESCAPEVRESTFDFLVRSLRASSKRRLLFVGTGCRSVLRHFTVPIVRANAANANDRGATMADLVVDSDPAGR